MYLILVLLLVLQRLWELQIAGSNVAHLKRRGAVEYGAEHYPLMVLLHGFWLFSCCYEWWSQESFFDPNLLVLAWLGFLLGQFLRWQAIRTLGRRWTTRVLILPNQPLVREGLFAKFPHPNYVGVALEIFCFPLIGGCWRTSLVFGILNLLLLKERLKVENEALNGPLVLREN